MGYNSGRSGDETKTLLNKVENHALYKGTATLAEDTPQSIGENHLIVGAFGNNCEVTDIISNTSLKGKVVGVGVDNSGFASLQELPSASNIQAGIINTEDQTFAGKKTFTNIKTSGLTLHNDGNDSDVQLTNSLNGELYVGANKVPFDRDVVHKADNETITGIKTFKTDTGGQGFAIRTNNTNINFTTGNSGPVLFNLLSNSTTSFPTTGTDPMGNLRISSLGGITLQDNNGFSYLKLPSQKGSSGSYATLAVDGEVVHKTGDEPITGTKYFVFEPPSGSEYTYKISLQPHEMAGTNKIVHTNDNGTTNYKLTLPDKNGTLLTDADLASVSSGILMSNGTTLYSQAFSSTANRALVCTTAGSAPT